MRRADDLDAKLQPKTKAGEGSFYRRRENRIGSGDRWHTLNEFVDVIAPRLSLAERAVWLVMFRHARGGVCETTARTLANATTTDKGTVAKALRTFNEIGLVWPVWKSRDKSKSSRYGMHPRPAECLPKLLRRRPR